jgi:hypothetical protein
MARPTTPVQQLDKDGITVIKTWDSVYEAAIVGKFSRGAIRQAVSRGCKHKGFFWKKIEKEACSLKTTNYLSGEALRNEIAFSKNLGHVTNKLAKMFQLMIDRMSLKFSYKDPKDREDCKSEAMLRLLLYYHNYTPEKSKNAFAYMSQIIKNGMGFGWGILCNQGGDRAAGLKTKRQTMSLDKCVFLNGSSDFEETY